MYWVHFNNNNFVFKKEECDVIPDTTAAKLISVDKVTYDKIDIGWKLRPDGLWESFKDIGMDANDSPSKMRVKELKSKLRDTDWVVLEVLEAQLMNKDTPHDIQEIYNQRQEWRNEIVNIDGV